MRTNPGLRRGNQAEIDVHPWRTDEVAGQLVVDLAQQQVEAALVDAEWPR